MRSIRISEEVWQAIATRGKFGETEDDVLRRVFDLPSNGMHNEHQPSTGAEHQASPNVKSSSRIIRARQRMSAYVKANQVHVAFHRGPAQSWQLPQRSDKDGIRAVWDQAVRFALEHGATDGQVGAVKKALTEAGYHLYR